MIINFNDAEAQNQLIPDGTKAKVNIKIRPGGSGEGGWFKPTKAGDKLMLDLEFTVVDGPFAKRKFWELMTIQGNDCDEAINISRSRLRALLESARGIKSTDQSDVAKAKRMVNSYNEFDGLEPYVSIRIEKSNNSAYPDKNRLGYAITPDHREWAAVTGGGTFNQVVSQGVSNSFQGSSMPQAASAASSKPSWAQ